MTRGQSLLFVSIKKYGEGKDCPLFLKKVIHVCSISNKLDHTEKVITCQLIVLSIIDVNWNQLYFCAIRYICLP